MMKSSKWLVNLRLTTPAAPASHVARALMPCSAGQANADEWFGILVARDPPAARGTAFAKFLLHSQFRLRVGVLFLPSR